MWEYVGIERSEDGLKKALTAIDALDLPKQVKELARAVAACAMERRESRGVHYRSDYPLMDEAYSSMSKYYRGRCYI